MTLRKEAKTRRLRAWRPEGPVIWMRNSAQGEGSRQGGRGVVGRAEARRTLGWGVVGAFRVAAG